MLRQTIPTRDFGEARNARPYRKVCFAKITIQSEDLRDLRPGADESHVSFYDIDEIRQLINACPAQPTAHSGHTWIVLVVKMKIQSITVPVIVEFRIKHPRILIHATKFMYNEWLS